MGGHCHCHNLRGTLNGNHATILSLCLSYWFALEIQSIFYFKENDTVYDEHGDVLDSIIETGGMSKEE